MADEIIAAEERSGSGQCDVILTIEDVNVDPSNILSLVVREWMYDDVKTPRLELIIADDGVFTDYSVPYRGKIIKVKASRDKMDKYEENSGSYIDSEFVIIDFNFTKELGSAEGNNSVITISGILNIPMWFEILPDMGFEASTSSDVVESVCNEIGLTLNSAGAVADSMNWLRINQTPGQFFQHVLNRSKATNENDVPMFWIDIYQNAYYNNLFDMVETGIVHKASYNIRYATEVNVDDLITMGAADGVEDNEMKTTVWYTSLTFRNNQGSNVTIKGGTTKEAHIDMNTGTYSFGIGNTDGTVSPILFSDVVEYNQFENLLSTEIDPNEIFNGVDNHLYSGTILTGQLDNLWGDAYLSNPFVRSSALSAIYTNSVLVEMSPHTATMIGEKIDLDVNSNIPNEDGSYINASLSGEYLITGSIYLLVEGFFKKILITNRTGFNEQDLGE